MKLTIIVPIYNHEEEMKEWLDVFYSQEKSDEVDVLVVDSSEDDKIECLCKEYSKEIKYKKYSPDISADEKIAIEVFTGQNDYIWLTSVGRIPNLDITFDLISQNINNSVDLIHFFGKNRVNIEYMEKYNFPYKITYTKENRQELFKYFWWDLAMWGTTIISKNITKQIDDIVSKIEYYDKSNFMFQTLIFEGIELMSEFEGVIYHHNCFMANKKRIINHWMEIKSDVLKIWTKTTYETITKMPSFYDEYKNDVIKNCWKNNGMFKEDNLLVWKQKGILTQKTYHKYKEYLLEMSDYSNEEFERLLD